MYTVTEKYHTYYWKVVARRYPCYAVIAVASVDQLIDGTPYSFAVYLGAEPDKYKDEDLNWVAVALDGMKQSEEVARAYFPHLKLLPYRH